MTASEILQGILTADKVLFDVFRDMVRDNALPASYGPTLTRIMQRHRLVSQHWQQDPDGALNEIMAIGHDLLDVMDAMMKAKEFPFQYTTEIEDALARRLKWAEQFTERQRGVPVIWGPGGKRAN